MNDPDSRAELADTFTRTALADAHTRGLLLPNGGGSLTHPTRGRLIYGDGTILRPRFRDRTRKDTAGRQAAGHDDDLTDDGAPHRVDPSAQEHHRHDGNIYGNNFVFISTRGPARSDRVILAVGRVPAPGGEAATAMSNPAGYLYRVAQTHAKRALSRGRPIVLPVAVPGFNDAASSLPDVGLVEALRQLPDAQRMVVLLVHAYGWTPSEVAGLTGMRAVTVRSNLHRALRTLRLNLPQGDPQ